MPFLLLIGAVVVTGAAILLILWQMADRRVRPRLTAGDVRALNEQLRAAETERQEMQRRIEQLEAIAAEKPLRNGL